MDREWGSKPGSGGAASAQNEAIDRRERLRRLALETIDLAKDPYFMRNHLGRYTHAHTHSLFLSLCLLCFWFWFLGFSFFLVMSVNFAWHSTTMRGITWLTRKENGIKLIWPRELLVRLRKLLLSLNPTNAKSLFVRQASKQTNPFPTISLNYNLIPVSESFCRTLSVLVWIVLILVDSVNKITSFVCL